MQFNQSIQMPNEIFSDMKEWLVLDDLKSIQHQEFVYSYYWLLAYLWRFAVHSEHKITQSDIKRMLNYNPKNSRLDYIMKRDGLMDSKSYTKTTIDYPVSWSQKGKDDVQFTMLHHLDKEYREYVSKFIARNNFVKNPLKHTGEDVDEEGVFWNISNTHSMSGEMFKICMSNTDLGCAGFYLYGVLVFIRDKIGVDEFPCANETLATYTGWNEKRIIRITNCLQTNHLLHKDQIRKMKGSVNHYSLT